MKRRLTKLVILVILMIHLLSVTTTLYAMPGYYGLNESNGLVYYERISKGLRSLENKVTLGSLSTSIERFKKEGEVDHIKHAIYIVSIEYPELFWFSGSGSIIVQGKEISLNIKPIESYGTDKKLNLNTIYLTQNKIDAVTTPLIKQTIEYNSDYDKIKYFHDWIINHTVYHTEAAKAPLSTNYEKAYTIEGVFIEGEAVCEGYAKAFKYLCDKVDIPCVVVTGVAGGESHAWNYVQLEGKWYFIDVTWDDPTNSLGENLLRYDYFLKGSGSKVKGISIKESHIENISDPQYPAQYAEYFQISENQYDIKSK